MKIPTTQADLQKLIDGKVEESLMLDYKNGASLSREDKKKDEITKDITAFANSAGGVVIYGLAEGSTDETEHLAVAFAPVDRTVYSKEWLEQIIHRAQPRLAVEINPIQLATGPNDVAYAVAVPQGDTAHQAMDKRYYKRFNFMSVPMEDYELRDVMNRRRHPKLKVSVLVNSLYAPENAAILIHVENLSAVIAKKVMIQVDAPVSIRGQVAYAGPTELETTDEGDFYRFRLFSDAPIFPGSDMKFRKKFTGARLQLRSGREPNSIPCIRISIFADEMQPIHGSVDVEAALQGWVIPS